MAGFFSWSGRMNRMQYFGNNVALGALFGVASYVILASRPGPVGAIIYLLVTVPILLRWLAICSRRLHDCDLPGGLAVVQGLFSFFSMQNAALAMIAFIGNLALTFWPGTKGANEYGPAPGEEEEETVTVRTEAQPASRQSQVSAASSGSSQAAAQKLVEECFRFTDYQGRSVSFAERLELYTVFGLVPSQISEGEKNWLSFEITMLRFFRLKELLRSDMASADQIRLAAELDIAFLAKYQSNASYLSIVNNRLARYETLARECGGDTGKFYERAAPIVFATANIEDERLRLHMLSQEVAAWESMIQNLLAIKDLR